LQYRKGHRQGAFGTSTRLQPRFVSGKQYEYDNSMSLLYVLVVMVVTIHAVVKGREGREKEQIYKQKAMLTELQKKAEREEEEYQRQLASSQQQPQLESCDLQVGLLSFFFLFFFFSLFSFFLFCLFCFVFFLLRRHLIYNVIGRTTRCECACIGSRISHDESWICW
jgi:hypothetical protein